jgi:hypothetical protein
MKLMSKLKNENSMREFVGISGEYYNWVYDFLFKNLRNAAPKFKHYPQTNGILLSNNNKYKFNTTSPILLILD